MDFVPVESVPSFLVLRCGPRILHALCDGDSDSTENTLIPLMLRTRKALFVRLELVECSHNYPLDCKVYDSSQS